MSDEPRQLEEWKCPRYYMGQSWDGWLVAPCGQSRESDSVEQSNFRVLVQRLEEVEEADTDDFIKSGGDDADEMCCGHTIVRESHFLVGWVEWIAIPPHAKRSIEVCLAAKDDLEGYPILDEDDHSSLEAEDSCDDDEDEEDTDDE